MPELFPGLCACYGNLCYAGCTCVNCQPHQYSGVILAGKRYFRVMDLWPDHPIMDTLVTAHFADGPSMRDQVRNHPDMLVAAEVATLMPKSEPLRTKKKVQTTSRPVPDSEVQEGSVPRGSVSESLPQASDRETGPRGTSDDHGP